MATHTHICIYIGSWGRRLGGIGGSSSLSDGPPGWGTGLKGDEWHSIMGGG